MKTIGITGGIGSGKTLITRILSAMNYPVYIADLASHRLVHTNIEIMNGLTALFGKNIYECGILNKKLLADGIFGNENLRKSVNNLIHPVVMQDFKDWCEEQNADVVFMESAILFETKLNVYVDKTILVIATLDLKIKRLKQRENLTETEIRNRINSQMSDEEKMKLADYIIINDERQAVLPQVEEIINQL
ncbi:MAG: dephospho-CoA kinase [Prevotellaceae bacterium]|jgi:dephospho-CoA kinase|nr:dephospho-CoA kinase [Prevotellaceae bacterium]